jgi:DNA-binding transcriptional LysR family regulator
MAQATFLSSRSSGAARLQSYNPLAKGEFLICLDPDRKTPMAPKIDWESQIGRRLRFRDLHVLSIVVRLGSMAKAAAQLGVTQPSVSEVIADLERALGVRLLDRSPKGIEPTIYASALLKRSLVAFDELKQGIRDIECLADPTVGQFRIGCPESVASSALPAIIQRMSARYPRVIPDVDAGPTDEMIRGLLDRSLDLVIARGRPSLADPNVMERLSIEVLFRDEVVVAAGLQNRWVGRRKISLAELKDEPWILSSPGTWNHTIVMDAFRTQGLDPPKIALNTLSVHLRANLLASGPYITVFPLSVLRSYGSRFLLKVLPINLPPRPWPVTIVTLKHRTLSPVVERFIDCAREVAKSFAVQAQPRKT